MEKTVKKVTAVEEITLVKSTTAWMATVLVEATRAVGKITKLKNVDSVDAAKVGPTAMVVDEATAGVSLVAVQMAGTVKAEVISLSRKWWLRRVPR